jgi:hypothetical protein
MQLLDLIIIATFSKQERGISTSFCFDGKVIFTPSNRQKRSCNESPYQRTKIYNICNAQRRL